MTTRVAAASSPHALLPYQLPEFVRSESQDAQERAYVELHAVVSVLGAPLKNVAEASAREKEIASAVEWLAVQRDAAGRR